MVARSVATGSFKHVMVFNGWRVKTKSGKTAADYMRNNARKIVLKSRHLRGKVAYKNIYRWTVATQQARKEMNLTGFVPMRGATPQGQALYAKTMAIWTRIGRDNNYMCKVIGEYQVMMTMMTRQV